MPIRTVSIVSKPGKPEALDATREALRFLEQKGVQGRIAPHAAEALGRAGSSDSELADSDLVLVLGGDGTLIHAASILASHHRHAPVVGVNLGSLGFMTEVPIGEMLQVLDQVLEGHFTVERRMRLQVKVQRNGKEVRSEEVLNDAVINKGALARMAELEVSVDGRYVTGYRADGAIVATPTGSTAYSLSANGPIVVPTLEAILITPICPHSLAQRPIVIPHDRAVEMTLKSSNGDVYLTLDGQSGMALEQGDKLIVQRGESPLILVKNPKLDFFSLLRAKLKWGER